MLQLLFCFVFDPLPNIYLVAKDAIASNNPIQRVGHISRYLQRRYLLLSQIKGQLW